MRFLMAALTAATTVLGIENSVIGALDQVKSGSMLQEVRYARDQWAHIQSTLAKRQPLLRIVSYNMLHDIRDHTLAKEHRWPERLPRIVEHIAHLNADVICPQELQPNQVKELLAHIGDRYTFWGEPKKGEVNGILFLKERFKLIDKEFHRMSAPSPRDVHKRTRNLHIAILQERGSGATFAVSNCHVAFSDPDSRAYSAEYVGRRMGELSQQMPAIACGDFNTFAQRHDLPSLPFFDGQWVIDRVEQGGRLKDSRAQAVLGHIGPTSTYTNRGASAKAFQGLGNPGVILDHIFVSEQVTVLTHAVDGATFKGEFPSDHMPVIVDLLLTTSEVTDERDSERGVVQATGVESSRDTGES